MTFSNSYIRAFLVCTGIFIAVSIRFLQMYGGVRDSRHIALAVTTEGFAFLIATVLVGTFSRRSEKPWSWLKIGVACLGCWFAVLCVIVLLQSTFYTR